MDTTPTVRRWRHRLPHWEVEGRFHFITIRCEGSLPSEVIVRLREIQENLKKISGSSREFIEQQRRYFITGEKYLDRGNGWTPFEIPDACEACLGALQVMADEGWPVESAVIMPNHVHMLIRRDDSEYGLRAILKRFKGRSGRWVNQALSREGSLWQEDWFDRWMRDEWEVRKTKKYIKLNPVKAGLANSPEEFRWYFPRLRAAGNELI